MEEAPEAAGHGGEHPFAGPPNPNPPEWCVCGRCWPMPTARENICCRERVCVTTRGEFRAVALDYDVNLYHCCCCFIYTGKGKSLVS